MKNNKLAILLNYFLGYSFFYPIIISLFVRDGFLLMIINILLTLLITLKFFYPKLISDFKRTNFIHLSFKVLGIVLRMTLVNTIISIAISSVFNIGNSSNQETINEVFAYSQAIVSFIILVFAPIVEEGVFRYSLKELLPQKLRGKFFLILSSISFGLIHIIDGVITSKNLMEGIFLINYSVLGYFIAKSYQDNDDNIMYPMAVHFLYNGVTLCLMLMA